MAKLIALCLFTCCPAPLDVLLPKAIVDVNKYQPTLKYTMNLPLRLVITSSALAIFSVGISIAQVKNQVPAITPSVSPANQQPPVRAPLNTQIPSSVHPSPIDRQMYSGNSVGSTSSNPFSPTTQPTDPTATTTKTVTMETYSK
jgi:hypothetical protein